MSYISRTFENLNVAGDVSSNGQSMNALYSQVQTLSGSQLSQASADARYDAINAGSSAETASKAYADSLASNYEVAGASASAETASKAYADSLASNYEVAGASASAETASKAYADSLASNYDASGLASSAETASKAYADSLASNYEVAGASASEASARASAITSAVAPLQPVLLVTSGTGAPLVAGVDASALTADQSGRVYFCDASSSDQFFLLPASPANGWNVSVMNTSSSTGNMNFTSDNIATLASVAPLNNALKAVYWNQWYFFAC